MNIVSILHLTPQDIPKVGWSCLEVPEGPGIKLPLLVGDCPAHWRMFSSIPGVYSVDASRSPPPL